MTLPEIIEYKQFKEELTKEQQIFNKIVEEKSLNNSEEKILDELIEFYESTTKESEQLNLKNFSSNDLNLPKKGAKRFFRPDPLTDIQIKTINRDVICIIWYLCLSNNR